MLSRYEHGHCVPSLALVLKLGIALRAPVEFLFPRTYDELRLAIRAENRPVQPTLFAKTSNRDVPEQHS